MRSSSIIRFVKDEVSLAEYQMTSSFFYLVGVEVLF